MSHNTSPRTGTLTRHEPTSSTPHPQQSLTCARASLINDILPRSRDKRYKKRASAGLHKRTDDYYGLLSLEEKKREVMGTREMRVVRQQRRRWGVGSAGQKGVGKRRMLVGGEGGRKWILAGGGRSSRLGVCETVRRKGDVGCGPVTEGREEKIARLLRVEVGAYGGWTPVKGGL